MIKKVISLLLIAITILSFTACGKKAETASTSVDEKTSSETAEKIPLKVRISNFAGTVVPYHIAVDYGFIEKAFADSKYDVTIEITNFSNGAAAVEAAQAGELDILTSGDQMITTAIIDNGLPFKVIGTSYTNTRYAFIAGKNSGVKSIDDIKGTKVGVTIGTNYYLGVLAFLEDIGLSVDDVEVVNLSPADAYTAVVSGDIDWALLTGKNRDILLNEEGGILLGYNGDYKFNECVFGVSNKFAAEYPDVVTTLVKVFAEVTDYANANPDVIRECTKKNYDSDDETINLTIKDTNYIVNFTDEILNSIQRTLHYAYTQGINSREADVSEVIDFTYLERAGLR